MALRALAAVGLVLLLSAAPAHAAAPQLLVSWDRHLSPATEQRLADQSGGRVARRLGEERVALIRARPGVTQQQLIDRLRALSDVVQVEPNRPLVIDEKPDDTSFHDQYALGSGPGSIDIQRVWDHDRTCTKVAVVDSGAEFTHPDLKKNIWTNSDEKPDNGKDDDHDGAIDDFYGSDTLDLKGNAADRQGHGTHVSGIIGARGNNDRGVAGICWSVQLIEGGFIRSDGVGETDAAITAINAAVHSGAKVINCSWGGGRTEALDRAVEYAREKKVLIVAAAGNSSDNVDKTGATFEEDAPNVLMVAASDDKGKLWSGSSYGKTTVDIAAPGVNVLSTYTEGRYAYLTGTSMAAPMVAGVAALLRHEFPNATAQQVRAAIIHHPHKVSSMKGKVASGGMLDAYEAWKALR